MRRVKVFKCIFCSCLHREMQNFFPALSKRRKERGEAELLAFDLAKSGLDRAGFCGHSQNRYTATVASNGAFSGSNWQWCVVWGPGPVFGIRSFSPAAVVVAPVCEERHCLQRDNGCVFLCKKGGGRKWLVTQIVPFCRGVGGGKGKEEEEYPLGPLINAY